MDKEKRMNNMIIVDRELKTFPIPNTINSTLIHYGSSNIIVDWNKGWVRVRGFKGKILKGDSEKRFIDLANQSVVRINTEKRIIEVVCVYGQILQLFSINGDQMNLDIYPERRRPLFSLDNTPIKDEKVKKTEDFKMACLFGITSMGLLALALVATILGV